MSKLVSINELEGGEVLAADVMTDDYQVLLSVGTTLKTDYIEFDMNKELFFDSYIPIEYIESNIKNIKIEYQINKYCNIDYSSNSNKEIYIWAYCDNPIKIIKEVINNINNKKIININNEIKSLKIYASKDNISIIKNNRKTYYNDLEDRQSLINSFESRINNLQDQIETYIEKEYEYKEEISNLKDKLFMYENEE